MTDGKLWKTEKTWIRLGFLQHDMNYWEKIFYNEKIKFFDMIVIFNGLLNFFKNVSSW